MSRFFCTAPQTGCGDDSDGFTRPSRRERKSVGFQDISETFSSGTSSAEVEEQLVRRAENEKDRQQFRQRNLSMIPNFSDDSFDPSESENQTNDYGEEEGFKETPNWNADEEVNQLNCMKF